MPGSLSNYLYYLILTLAITLWGSFYNQTCSPDETRYFKACFTDEMLLRDLDLITAARPNAELGLKSGSVATWNSVRPLPMVQRGG